MDDYTEYEQALVRAMGRRIAAERVSAGLSQEQLAQRVGLSKKSVTRYENGERDAQFLTLVSIARVLGLSSVIELTSAAEEQAKREIASKKQGGDS